MPVSRRRSVGAEIVPGGVHFRVWAPDHQSMAVVRSDGSGEHELTRETGGYFSGLVERAGAGFLYKLRVDGAGDALPDPASRSQPQGPHGPSRVVDPSTFHWQTTAWRAPQLAQSIIYELHVGTFTREGTFAAAIDHLGALAEMGINVIEVMPLHEFPGRFGWGYDGVDLWAPSHLYGEPDDFRRFIDAAHSRDLAVILDVVFNHLGPDGNFLKRFAEEYFTAKYVNDWGEAVNFENAGSREFFIECGGMWVEEYHLDGLRLDATQSISDESRPHVLKDITSRAREAARGRTIIIVAENEPQDVRLIDEYCVDALWNDDWHHSTHVALTGLREAYYTDYLARPQEFVSMARQGFLYQGQWYSWQKQGRGTPSSHLAPERFITYLENHDQVANTAFGARMHHAASAGDCRALTALLLLSPHTPMLFQGQEFGASAPFLYFADHEPELAQKVAEGRREFLQQFPSIGAIADQTPLPHDPATFERCKLDQAERETNRSFVDLHRDLIRLRRPGKADGAVIGEKSFVLRWPDRLLLINLGSAFHLEPAPEPLLALPRGRDWSVLWSSEDPKYGGSGMAEWTWRVPGHSAVLLESGA